MIRPGTDVSVVICAYTELRWDRLIEAVESVQRQSLPARETVVVVDHNETLLARLSSALSGIRTVANREEKGLSGARNTGIEATSGEWIVFLDDDAVAAEDWLERLSGHRGDPATMGVGGAVWPVWPGERPRWFPEEFDWVVGCSYWGLPGLAAPVRNPLGANMCLRREVFNTVGGFRNGMGRVGANEAGCEETELCIRARKRWTERRFVYEPLARVYHHVPESRARWSYFRARCFAEGISKRHVAQLVGRADGLSAEGTHVLRALPRGIARGIADAVIRGDLSGLSRSGVIVAGLTITIAGYLVGTAGYREADRRPDRRRRGPRVDRAAEARTEVGKAGE